MIDWTAVKWKPRRIAIFRALQLGDLLESIPAMRAMRVGFPGAEITLVGLPWAESFVQRFHRYLDRFVEFAGYPGIAEAEIIPERTLCFLDAQVILTGNSDEEAIVHSITERMATKPINLVGRTSLGGLAALISALDLFVSNDTGPAHIACAVDTLSITIFGPADYRRWTPLDQKRHPVIRRPVECSPCSYWD